MNKKIIALTAAMLSVYLTGCGSTENSTTQESKTTTAITTTAETTAEVTTEAETTTVEGTVEATTANAGNSDGSSDENSADSELEQIAIKKMDTLTKINGYISGKIGYDENDTVKDENGADLIRVTEPGINSIADIESLVNDTCAGELKEDYLKSINSLFVEKDGKLYFYYTAHGFYIYPTAGGVKISDVTENSFTAETVDSSAYGEHGKTFFVKNGDNWLIDIITSEE